MSKYIPGNQKHLTLEGHIYIETSLNKGLAFKDIVRSLGGNDFATPLPARKRTDFNPRSHEGNDPTAMDHMAQRSISIHVPTRGTTCGITAEITKMEFQSTFPRGERHVV